MSILFWILYFLFHKFLFYPLYLLFIYEDYIFSFVKSEFVIAYFYDYHIKSLTNIFVILMLVCIAFFSLKMIFSWFSQVWSVIFYCILDILGLMRLCILLHHLLYQASNGTTCMGKWRYHLMLISEGGSSCFPPSII